ncbi:hypothetical protein PFISCL1PPCAC_1832, partial [Pristionchus fissidentatus]
FYFTHDNHCCIEMVEVGRALQDIISSTPGISSIFVTDRDGVPIASSGTELRSRAALVQSYQITMEPATKLDMGPQKYAFFYYEQRQVAVITVHPMVIFVIATPDTNSGVLMSMGERMEPLLQQLEKIIGDLP